MHVSPVYLRAGQGLSRSTGGTLLQLAVTAPMMPPATSPVPTAVRVRETQSSGLSTGSLSDWTDAGILAPEMPLILASRTPWSQPLLSSPAAQQPVLQALLALEPGYSMQYLSYF